MTMSSYDSFGRVQRHMRDIVLPSVAIMELRSHGGTDQPLLAYGNGRSYGDTCHNDDGALVPMRSRNAILDFDLQTGVITAETGVTLEELIAHATPHGYFLPVTPGTRYVTLGGAIANDVHGKNHHSRGSFGCHVTALELLRSDGGVHVCSPQENAELFQASIGGMGLTGLMLSASLRLMPVGSLDIDERVMSFGGLAEYFDAADAADAGNEYSVAWIDQLSTSNRGILFTGNHANNGNFRIKKPTMGLSVPLELPFSVLNRVTLAAFNQVYFTSKARRTQPQIGSYRSFFYPLDTIGNWNRLYGPKGLHQHQSIIPFSEAQAVIPQMLEASRDAGQASLLTVLKRFGHISSPGMLSFARPGYTLAMDFANQGPSTLALLETLDRLTVECGGRVNPYKDQRMSAATFAAGFPDWQKLERFRDPRFSSNFWRRTALTLPQRSLALVK